MYLLNELENKHWRSAYSSWKRTKQSSWNILFSGRTKLLKCSNTFYRIAYSPFNWERVGPLDSGEVLLLLSEELRDFDPLLPPFHPLPPLDPLPWPLQPPLPLLLLLAPLTVTTMDRIRDYSTITSKKSQSLFTNTCEVEISGSNLWKQHHHHHLWQLCNHDVIIVIINSVITTMIMECNNWWRRFPFSHQHLTFPLLIISPRSPRIIKSTTLL